MAGSGGTQLRKALGALKDSTKVGLAKVNSDYKDLDVAIVKATNHVEHLAKEKHIRSIFDAVSAQRSRADVAYCIHALARRLAKTHNWAVALKTMIVIHRALREVDPTFREELINYTRSRGHLLNLSHFKDDSSPNAWDYSAWVRMYALYVEERLECFRILKYDVESDRSKTSDLDTDVLLEHLPALQQLLFRLLSCQPEGAAVYNYVIQYALSIVASESVKVYSAINEGVLNLVDKFFGMQRHDAVRALEIYKKAGKQTERLSEFYEICRGLELGRQKFIKLEQPPASFVTAMEEYVQDAPRTLLLQRNVVNDDREATPKAVATPREALSIDQNKETEVEETPEVSETPPEAPQTPPEAPHTPPEAPKSEPSEAPVSPVADLLGLDELIENVSNLDEKNSLALAIITSEGQSSSADNLSLTGENSGWELALVGAQSSNDTAVAGSKLGGGLDKLTLDSLYEDAMVRRANPNGAYHTGQVGPSFGGDQYNNTADPFSASSSIAPPTNVQLATMTQQQQAFTMQQQTVNQDPTNPFGNPYVGQGAAPYPPQNHYTGFI